MNWTTHQNQAINDNGGTIIVSAAAGSGKTAVLVQRIINKILDPKNNVDIDELLIVTFSNHAAIEIKERLTKKIDDILALDPTNQHLIKQQILIESSHISTIHSFCLDLIKENFEALDISPDFKIGDESQISILKQQAFNETSEEFYADKDFIQILELLDISSNDTNLFNFINNIFEFITALPFPFDWLEKNLIMYSSYTENDISNSFTAQSIFKFSIELLIQSKNILKKCIDIIDNEENYESYFQNFNQKLNFIESLISIVKEKKWDKTYNYIHQYEITPLPRSKKNADVEKIEIIKNLHNTFKSIIVDLKTNYFSVSSKEFISDMNYNKKILSSIINFIKHFSLKFNDLKQTKNLLDFSDLEHLAIKLLLDYDGEICKKTIKAQTVSNKFKEILIDEYQDTNLTQEYIFKAVSQNESNIFMVGDAKQSIYRFRQAMPELFINKNTIFSNYDKITYPAKIILKQNFRSREEITSAINFIFMQLMSINVGEINYDKSQSLINAADYPIYTKNSTEIHIIENKNKLSNKEQILAESTYIAKLIKKMINSKFKITKNGVLTTANYSDFCILMRSPNNRLNLYLQAFKDNNVPLNVENYSSFFDIKEITTIVSFLKIINNPFNDIDLLSIMLSELFSFSPDDVLMIIKKYNKEKLFLSLQCAAKDGHLKAIELCNIIKNLKSICNTMPLDKFIQTIYDKTDFYNIVGISHNGPSRQSNLNIFKNLATSASNLGNKSLIEFIHYIDNLSNQKFISSITIPNQNENCVQIMSIHKSKGLEFPICILSDTSKNINRVDINSPVLLHADVGIGFNRIDKKYGIKFPTIQKNALKLEIEKNMISEELRILYVALSRAREKLIITTFTNDYESKISKLQNHLSINNNDIDELKISPYIIKNCKSYSDLIILSLLRHPNLFIQQKTKNYNILQTLKTNSNIKVIIKDSTNEIEKTSHNKNMPQKTYSNYNQNIINKIDKNINYIYPFKNQTTILSKLGVSDITKKISNNSHSFEKRPKIFYKHGLTNAEKGNILHKFMQFANYDNAKSNIYDECKRLLKYEFISKEEYDNLNKNKLSHFFNSDLYNMILTCNIVHREIRFVYPIAASRLGFSEANDNIIVQGVADCILENEDEIIIIDYKTDKIEKIEELKERYKNQLYIYQEALSHIFNKPSNKSIIYSFYLNQYITLHKNNNTNLI